MSDYYSKTGLSKNKTLQQEVGKEEKKEIDRFLKEYQFDQEEISYREVRDSKRNFKLLDHCRSKLQTPQITSSAEGSPQQIVQPAELTWKEKRERDAKIKEARSHIPNADLSVFEGAQTLEKLKSEYDASGNDVHNFAALGVDEKIKIIDELLDIELDESMLTDEFIMSHMEEMCRYTHNLNAVRNYYLSEEGHQAYNELDELERGIINSRIMSLAVPMQKHLEAILLRRGLSLKNMTYVDLKKKDKGSEGDRYLNTDHDAAVTDTYADMYDVLQAAKDAEGAFFGENLGATIHAAGYTLDNLDELADENPGRYMLVKEYLEAEAQELSRRSAAKEAEEAAKKAQARQVAEEAAELVARKAKKKEEDEQQQRQKEIDAAAEAEEKERERQATIDKRKKFISSGKIKEDEDAEHQEKWVLSDYSQILWEKYSAKCDSNNEDDFIKDDNAFYAEIISINEAVSRNRQRVKQLVKSKQAREVTFGLPLLEDELQKMLEQNKAVFLEIDEEKFESSINEIMSKTKAGEDGEYEIWKSRYDTLKDILPESCFESEGGTALVGDLMCEKNVILYDKKVEALVNRKVSYQKILKDEVAEKISPLCREQVEKDIAKNLDYKMIFSSKKGVTAEIRDRVRPPLLMIVSPESAYIENDFKMLLSSYKLPMSPAYVEPLTTILLEHKDNWQNVKSGSDRVEAMKAIVDKQAKNLALVEKSRQEDASKEQEQAISKKDETVKPAKKKESKPKDDEGQRRARHRAWALFTSDVSDTQDEIFYQYHKVKGEKQLIGQAIFDITYRERRFLYARKVWNILEDKGQAAECAEFFCREHTNKEKGEKHLPKLKGNSPDQKRQAAREKIQAAIAEALKPGAVTLPSYMDQKPVSGDDIYHELHMMGLDVQMLSDGCAGESALLTYKNEDYEKQIDDLGMKTVDRYVGLENLLNDPAMKLSDKDKAAYRKRLHKVIGTTDDAEWAEITEQFKLYIDSLHSDKKEDRHVAKRAATVHKYLKENTGVLKKFDGGKFDLIIDRLQNDPDIMEELVKKQDAEKFDLYVEGLNDTYGVLMDAVKDSKIPEFVVMQYMAAHYDNAITDLKEWNSGLDKTEMSEEDLQKARADKVSEFTKILQDYFIHDFLDYKVEGRRSIKEHIDKVWNSINVSIWNKLKIVREKKPEELDVKTYAALLMREDGASLKSLYKEGTIEKELSVIGDRQKQYAGEIETAFMNAKLPAALKTDDRESYRTTFKQFIFIHAGELPEVKAQGEAAAKERQANANKLAKEFFKEMAATEAKEAKVERKSQQTLREEREFARNVASEKKRGHELEEKTFYMKQSPAFFESIMKSRSVLFSGTESHMDNKTKELEEHDKKLNKIVGKEGMDPFVYMCLLEKYQSLEHSASSGDSKDFKKQQIVHDHQYLSRLQVLGENQGYEKDKRDCFIAWFYRHTDPETMLLGFDTNSDSDFLDNPKFKDNLELFEQGYEAISSLESLKVKDPVVKREQIEYVARMRMLFFTADAYDQTMQDMALSMNRKRLHLFLEDVMASMYDEALQENTSINVSEDADLGRYKTGLKEFFSAQLTDVVLAHDKGENAKAEPFDLEKFRERFKNEINKVLEDSGKWQFLYDEKIKEPLKSEDGKEAYTINVTKAAYNDAYGEQKAFEGQKTGKDLDELIRNNEGIWDKKAYNTLTPEEQKLFALALTITSEGGNTIYEGTALLLKSEEERANIQKTLEDAAGKYLSGEKIEGFIDYDLAYRRLLKDKTGTKGTDKYNTDVFAEAMQFTKLIKESRKEKLMKESVDRSILNDGLTSLRAANEVGAKQQLTFIEQNDISTVADFQRLLEKEIYKEDSKVSSGVRERFEKLIKEDKLWMLIEVLQDRNTLDFSSGEIDEEGSEAKIIGHVDENKRGVVKERFMDDLSVDKLRKRSKRAAHVRKAMLSVLSFQLRDNSNFAGRKFKKDDFAKKALDRKTFFDWDLIGHGMDLLDEVTNEKNRRMTIESNYIEVVGNKKQTDAYKSLKAFKEKKGEYDASQFDMQLMAFMNEDFAEGRKGDEHAAILAGYFALSDQEKALFFRALEHRDVLDISKVNLYWNIVGRGDRDYVNPEGRNALIDEFILSTKGAKSSMVVGQNTVYNAMQSLLSTQIDDSLNFADEKMDIKKAMAGEKMYIFQRDTAIDWKLFARALQMVHRARAERDMTRGDMELQRALGDISSTGRMSMDASFMRSNIHRTGGRFFRFVGKEVGDQVAKELHVDTLQSVASWVLSVDKRNSLNSFLNHLEFEEEEEDEEEEEEEEEEDKEEDTEEASFIKSMTSLFFGVRGAINDVKEAAESEKEEEEPELTKLQKVLTDNEIEIPPTLKERLKEGVSSVLDVLADLPDNKEDLDKAVKENKDTVAKLLGKKITEAVVGWYQDKSEGVDNFVDDVAAYVDAALEWIPQGVRDTVIDVADKFDSFWEDYGEDITGYVEDAAKSISNMISIYDSFKGIKELNEAEGKMAEDRQADDENIAANIRTQTEQQKKDFADARARNAGLASLSVTFSKDRNKEDIIVSTGEIAGIAARITTDALGGTGAIAEEVIKDAAKFAAFIHHCLADHKGMVDYYDGPGRAVADEVRKSMEQKEHGKGLGISGLTGRVESMDNAKLVRLARGFESEEELVMHTAFEMAHSLMFSASDFNPLEETRNVSKVVLTVLGLEDLIGKTDKESAMKAVKALTR